MNDTSQVIRSCSDQIRHITTVAGNRRQCISGNSSRWWRVLVDIPRQQPIKSIKTGLLNTESIDNKSTIVADCITRNDFKITEVPSTTSQPQHPGGSIETVSESAANENNNSGLRIGSFNIHSVNTKTASVCDILATHSLDVLALQETWHEGTHSVSIRQASPPGYSVLEEARPLVKNRPKEFVVNHGEVAIVDRTNFKMTKMSTLPKVKTVSSYTAVWTLDMAVQ